MRVSLIVGATVAGVVALASVVVRPALLVPIVIGAAVALLGVVVLFLLRRRGGRRAPARLPPAHYDAHRVRSWRSLVLLVAAALAVVLPLASVVQTTQSPRPHVVDRRSVRSVSYAAVLEYAAATGRWHWTEHVRIPHSLFAAHASMRRMHLAGWDFVGKRGPHGGLVLYRHETAFRIPTSFWPLMTKRRLRLPVLRSRLLHATLVPRDGSVVEMQAPRRMIHDTDPPSAVSTYAGVDTFMLRVAGVEDGLVAPELRFEVANRFGRTSLYATLEDITGGKIVAWLFGIVSGVVFGFFLTRELDRRFPKTAT